MAQPEGKRGGGEASAIALPAALSSRTSSLACAFCSTIHNNAPKHAQWTLLGFHYGNHESAGGLLAAGKPGQGGRRRDNRERAARLRTRQEQRESEVRGRGWTRLHVASKQTQAN